MCIQTGCTVPTSFQDEWVLKRENGYLKALCLLPRALGIKTLNFPGGCLVCRDVQCCMQLDPLLFSTFLCNNIDVPFSWPLYIVYHLLWRYNTWSYRKSCCSHSFTAVLTKTHKLVCNRNSLAWFLTAQSKYIGILSWAWLIYPVGDCAVSVGWVQQIRFKSVRPIFSLSSYHFAEVRCLSNCSIYTVEIKDLKLRTALFILCWVKKENKITSDVR